LQIASAQNFVLENANHAQSLQFLGSTQLGFAWQFLVSGLVKFGKRFVMGNVCKLEGFNKVAFDKIILFVRCLGLVPPFQKERRNLVGVLVKTLDSIGWLDNLAETMWPLTQKQRNFGPVSVKVCIT
jgi:hypothetical protein